MKKNILFTQLCSCLPLFVAFCEEPGVYIPPGNDADTTGTYSQMNATLENYDSNRGDEKQVENWWEGALNFASEYMRRLDEGEYASTWGSNDKIIQDIIGKGEWQRGLAKTRSELGPVTYRELVDKRMAINPNGLPQGVYVILTYNTTFKNTGNGQEVLALHRYSDGRWNTLIYQSYQDPNPSP